MALWHVPSCFPVQYLLLCAIRQVFSLPSQLVCIVVIVKTLFEHILNIKACVSELRCFSFFVLVSTMFYSRFIDFCTGHCIRTIRGVFSVHLFVFGSSALLHSTYSSWHFFKSWHFYVVFDLLPFEQLCGVNFKNCSLLWYF